LIGAFAAMLASFFIEVSPCLQEPRRRWSVFGHSRQVCECVLALHSDLAATNLLAG
jgi:uncharacterized membrane protein